MPIAFSSTTASMPGKRFGKQETEKENERRCPIAEGRKAVFAYRRDHRQCKRHIQHGLYDPNGAAGSLKQCFSDVARLEGAPSRRPRLLLSESEAEAKAPDPMRRWKRSGYVLSVWSAVLNPFIPEEMEENRSDKQR